MRFYRPKFCGVLLIRFQAPPQQRASAAIGQRAELRAGSAPPCGCHHKSALEERRLLENSQRFRAAAGRRRRAPGNRQKGVWNVSFPTAAVSALSVLFGQRKRRKLQKGRDLDPACEAEARLVPAPASAPQWDGCASARGIDQQRRCQPFHSVPNRTKMAVAGPFFLGAPWVPQTEENPDISVS